MPKVPVITAVECIIGYERTAHAGLNPNTINWNEQQKWSTYCEIDPILP